MRLDVRADVDAVVRDLDHVAKKLAPRVIARVLNQVAQRDVESPAIRAVAAAVDIPIGVIRWHHNVHGRRTDKRRILRSRAKRGDLAVRWRWSTRNGVPGSVAFISLPGRRQTRAGFRSSTKYVPSGFIQRTKRGQVGAFVREAGAGRYPIRFLRRSITDPADRLFSGRVARTGPIFRAEFSRQLGVELAKKRVA